MNSPDGLALARARFSPEQLAERPWLASYPEGVPADVGAGEYGSLAELLDAAFSRYPQRVAFSFMGRDFSYAQVERLSAQLAAYLQSLGLQKGDRVAVMLPNIIQYPIAAAAIMRAGLVLVNVNPLYTARELQHQLQDSGARLILALENFAHTLAQCVAHTRIEHVVLAGVGDQLGPIRGRFINWVLRRRKDASGRKVVPGFTLPDTVRVVRFNEALRRGSRQPWRSPSMGRDDLALLQYTGGTTGVSKGAMLTHGNVIANTLQSQAWNKPAIDTLGGQPCVSVCVLPLYHIFGFTVGMMMSMRNGGQAVLIANPRDLDATLAQLRGYTIHLFPAVNTLFGALLNHPDFDRVDWSHLRITCGGGAAVQQAVAQRWLERTGCPICEGYGLSEASPSVACNSVVTKTFSGTIGMPLPSTYLRCVDEAGRPVPTGEPGEIAIKGPQLMAGYWQQPEETALVMTADGYFRTGDIGVMDDKGFIKIVDRKKDMVLVSGFNVYPNEIEDAIGLMPGVRECAVVGVPDEKTGEAIKLVIVKKDQALSEAQVHEYARSHLTGYKRPKYVEFRTELPKNGVGKILRRELRDKDE